MSLESHVADWVADAMTEALGSKIDAIDMVNIPHASED